MFPLLTVRPPSISPFVCLHGVKLRYTSEHWHWHCLGEVGVEHNRSHSDLAMLNCNRNVFLHYNPHQYGTEEKGEPMLNFKIRTHKRRPICQRRNQEHEPLGLFLPRSQALLKSSAQT